MVLVKDFFFLANEFAGLLIFRSIHFTYCVNYYSYV